MTGCPTPILLTDTQLNTCLTHSSDGAQGLSFSALQSVNAREVGQHQLVHLFHHPLQAAQRIGGKQSDPGEIDQLWRQRRARHLQGGGRIEAGR